MIFFLVTMLSIELILNIILVIQCRIFCSLQLDPHILDISCEYPLFSYLSMMYRSSTCSLPQLSAFTCLMSTFCNLKELMLVLMQLLSLFFHNCCLNISVVLEVNDMKALCYSCNCIQMICSDVDFCIEQNLNHLLNACDVDQEKVI